MDEMTKAIIKVTDRLFKDVYSRLEKIDNLLAEIKEELDSDREEHNIWEDTKDYLIKSNKKLKGENK